MSTTPLVSDDRIIEILERDLMRHCVQALNGKQINAYVNGVFSLDDLDTQMKNDEGSRVGVGVAYSGSSTVNVEQEGNSNADPRKAIQTDMLFLILLAAPVDIQYSQRHTATELLTVLKRGILGKSVDVTASALAISRGVTSPQRPWMLVQEKPEIAESTPSMLYYTQVWRLRMPVTGN